MAWGYRSSLPPQSWSVLQGMRCRPAWSCLGWAPCCRTPCCTCSWVSSPWCAALGREAWETSGAGQLNLEGRETQEAIRMWQTLDVICLKRNKCRRYVKSVFQYRCPYHTAYTAKHADNEILCIVFSIVIALHLFETQITLMWIMWMT